MKRNKNPLAKLECNCPNHQFCDEIQHLDTSVLLFFIYELHIYMQTQWEYLELKDVGQAQDPPDSWLQGATPFSNGFWVNWFVCVLYQVQALSV